MLSLELEYGRSQLVAVNAYADAGERRIGHAEVDSIRDRM